MKTKRFGRLSFEGYRYMGNDSAQSAETGNKQPNGGRPAKDGELSSHERMVLDYATAAATQVARIQTEELTVRTRQTVHTEIQSAFIAYTKLTMGRRVIMAVGAIAAFGAGFLIKGWLTKPAELEETNNVHD